MRKTGEVCHHCHGTGTEPDLRRLGATVRAARLRHGWTLRQLAKQARATPAYLSDLERGRRSWAGAKARNVLRLVEIVVPDAETGANNG